MRNRESYLLIGELVLFVFLICGVYIHYQKRIKTEKMKLDVLRKKVSLINQLEETDKIWREKAKVYLAEDILFLKENIKNKVNSRNIKIEEWKISPSQKKNLISEYEIGIRLYGNYDNFVEFIKDIEKVPFVKVKSLSIKRDAVGNLRVELRLLGEVKS